MKKIIYSIWLTTLSVGLISCVENETSANLQSMITAQANQSVKYDAYAGQATADGQSAIASMFGAAAQAQVISAAKLNEVLVSMGVKNFAPQTENPQVGTTSENFKNAIEAQNYEVQTLLPEYIKIARIENHLSAATAFETALAVEQHLENVFILTAQAVKNGDTIQMFSLCPTCGATFVSEVPEVCPICSTSSTSFKSFGAH